jgi:hypothetical protein
MFGSAQGIGSCLRTMGEYHGVGLAVTMVVHPSFSSDSEVLPRDRIVSLFQAVRSFGRCHDEPWKRAKVQLQMLIFGLTTAIPGLIRSGCVAGILQACPTWDGIDLAEGP